MPSAGDASDTNTFHRAPHPVDAPARSPRPDPRASDATDKHTAGKQTGRHSAQRRQCQTDAVGCPQHAALQVSDQTVCKGPASSSLTSTAHHHPPTIAHTRTHREKERQRETEKKSDRER